MNPKRILVPIDFSEQTEDCLSQAAALARQFDASLTLLHVHIIETIAFMDMTYVEPGPQVSEVCEAAKKKIEQMVGHIVSPRPETNIRVETGRPAEEIIRASSEHELIVMPTHGRSGLGHFLLGSVAERVVRGAKCSVLIVKTEPQDDASDTPVPTVEPVLA